MRYQKYRNRKTVVDGIVFDSAKEAIRYQELKMLQKAGVIQNLRLQVPYEIIPEQREASDEVYSKGPKKGQPKPGKILERKVEYIADFVYTENGQTVVEDVKGYRDGGSYKVFVLKRKLMLQVYGISVKEI